MNITGSVADQSTGKPIPNATVWEIQQGGQGASVIGQTDYLGRYNVDVDDGYSNLSFGADGFVSSSIPVSQAENTDMVLLAPSTVAGAASGIPVWVWLLLGAGIIYFISKKKK